MKEILDSRLWTLDSCLGSEDRSPKVSDSLDYMTINLRGKGMIMENFPECIVFVFRNFDVVNCN